MICRFKMPNEEYSEIFAKENHNGEESEDNFKILWEDEIELTGGFEAINEKEDSVYILKGLRGEEEFAIEVPQMRIWEFEGDQISTIAVSESIIDHFDLNSESKVLEVHFKEKSVISNVIPGVYIDVEAFPKELKP